MVETKTKPESALAASPETQSLIDEITQITVKPTDESYGQMRDAVGFFLAEMLQTEERPKVDKKAVDRMIAEYDRRLSRQVDQILHSAAFQELESAWRGLKLLVDGTDFRENLRIEMMNVPKDVLLDDFREAPEITKSGLYKQVYAAEYGTFGGEPYGAMIANYEFGPSSKDIKLLQSAAAVATMAHAPFIAAAGSEFFGLEGGFEGLPNMNDLADNIKGPKYVKWNSFRESENSRSVGLTCPRFLLRAPYSQEDNPVKEFNYEEDVSDSHEDYLWGNAAFAFATRLSDSFAKYRWCPNIIGPQAGGAVEDLPVHTFESMGQLQSKIPTEVTISERREVELAEQGFIGLTWRKGSDNAAFFSANSPQKPKNFGQSKEGKRAETNYKLGTQLPYLFVVNRLAHYIKVIQRETIGKGMSRAQLEGELDKWVRQYVADMDVVDDNVRAKRPLRQASVTVSDVEGDPGWYKVDLKVVPHMKYMGAFFELSLVGKLDTE